MEAATELIKKGQSGRLGTLEVGPFTLPNPGGGADLLEDAAMTLVPGHRYGLIGRNGKGKSTLLKWLASRRVAALDKALQVYYVHQEVSLSAEAESHSAIDVVLAADFELKLLLEERGKLESKMQQREHSDGDHQRHLIEGSRHDDIDSLASSISRIRPEDHLVWSRVRPDPNSTGNPAFALEELARLRDAIRAEFADFIAEHLPALFNDQQPDWRSN